MKKWELFFRRFSIQSQFSVTYVAFNADFPVSTFFSKLVGMGDTNANNRHIPWCRWKPLQDDQSKMIQF